MDPAPVRNKFPIQKQSVVSLIIDHLISEITQGVYKPGSKLPNEYSLIEQMQVSRNSLREAIKILSTMGIVEIRRGDGTYVCSQVSPTVFDNAVYSLISVESTSDEMLELRQIIDISTVWQAIDKITTDELIFLEQLISKMREAIQNNDIALAQQLDIKFHMSLIDCCKNKFFIRVAKGIYSIFEGSIGENIVIENFDSKAPDYHENILKCIKEKDYYKVNQVIKDSLRTWKNRI